MKSVRLLPLVLVLLAVQIRAQEPPVRITQKPVSLVHGTLLVPVTVAPDVARTELLINGVKFTELTGRSMVFPVRVGEYIRRLRIRAVGYDANGEVRGEDEMVVNDPRPPFRLRLTAPSALPKEGMVELSASITTPPDIAVQSVDFFVGEEKIASALHNPWTVSFSAERYPDPVYARATAHATNGTEANAVCFFGSVGRASDQVEVVAQEIPLSTSRPDIPLRKDELRLNDSGRIRAIESLTPAGDLPLSVIVLIDSSESMLKELPVVKEAARSFARSVLGPKDRMAIVKFSEQPYWLTPFTRDLSVLDASLDRLSARGETHLYDTTIQMLYELQKQPGRKALVVLTDGVNQGGSFNLDHVVHYARYSGVPVYPIVKNAMLSRFMKLPFARFDAQKYAEIAKDSGATYFIINRTAELPAVYRRISDELRHQYVLTIQSESDGSDTWHPLALEYARKDVTLRIPRGYFP